MNVKKYVINHPLLKNLVKYFWITNCSDSLHINHKLLPVCNIDLILNFSAPIKYISKNRTEVLPPEFHLSGIRNQHCWIKQSGKLDVIGISFFPLGLYPFLKLPLSEFANKTVGLELLNRNLAFQLKEALATSSSTAEKLAVIENTLVNSVASEFLPTEDLCQIFYEFFVNIANINIKLFCIRYGIHQRKLERIFNTYVGTTPKQFHRLHRFQKIVTQILSKNHGMLTSLAYEHDFYDQTHFIKDFQSFSGCSPLQFIKEKASVKQIMHHI